MPCFQVGKVSRPRGHTQCSGIGELKESGTRRGAGLWTAGNPQTLSCRECVAEWSFTYTDDIHIFAFFEISLWQQCR